MFDFTLQQYPITCAGQHVGTQAGCWGDTEVTARVVTQQCNCSLWRCSISKRLGQHSWHLNSNIQYLQQSSHSFSDFTQTCQGLCETLGGDFACVISGKRLSHLIHRTHHSSSYPALVITWWAGLVRGGAAPECSLQECAMNSVSEPSTVHIRWKSVMPSAMWIDSLFWWKPGFWLSWQLHWDIHL